MQQSRISHLGFVFIALTVFLAFETLAAAPWADAGALRIADATTDVCLSRCADSAAACLRACPTTVGVSCQASCDSQQQMCRQGCIAR